MISVLAFATASFTTQSEGLSIGFARDQYEAPAIKIFNNPKFLVSFSNVSKKSIAIMSENCSWGYEMVSFELTNAAGGKYTITRRPKAWYRNVPSRIVVDSGAVILRKINLGDGTWQGLPAGVSGGLSGWKVRAKLTIKNDSLFFREGIWTGQIASNWATASVKAS